MTKPNDGDAPDAEMEALRADPRFAKFKKLLKAAMDDDAPPEPTPEPDQSPLSFLDDLFGKDK